MICESNYDFTGLFGLLNVQEGAKLDSWRQVKGNHVARTEMMVGWSEVSEML